jgi:predicted RNA-binding Zn-ribbon protein involved in translation (DUF1610 family)
LCWDLECSNLNADFGIILCYGVKRLHASKPKVLNILDYLDTSGDLIRAEKRLLKDVSTDLLDGDLWVTHFGTWFDINFLNSRLLYHSLPIVPASFPHVDTWRISKNRLKLRNNRLATISEFLGTHDEKNAIKPEQWLRALSGHRASMNYIAEHCRLDVLVLEEVYLRIRSLAPKHPRGVPDACPSCGEKKLQRRGTQISQTRQYHRLHCQSCGAWTRSTKAIPAAA